MVNQGFSCSFNEVLSIPKSKISGIYGILNKINNKIYIGKSKDIRKRAISHLNKYQIGTHANYVLNKAINETGLENFQFIILCNCNNLKEMEIYFINKYSSSLSNYGYNIQNFHDNKIVFSKKQKIAQRRVKLEMDRRKGISPEIVKSIRQDYCEFYSIPYLINKYNLSEKQIYHIALNNTRKDPNYKPIRRNNGEKFKITRVVEIEKAKELLKLGESISMVSNKTGIGKSKISEIRKEIFKKEFDVSTTRTLFLDTETGIYYQGWDDACTTLDLCPSMFSKLIKSSSRYKKV